MKFMRLLLVLGVDIAMLAILKVGLNWQQAWAKPAAGQKISLSQVVNVTGCVDETQFQSVLDEFTTRTGINTQYDHVCDKDQLRNCSENLDCPDIAIVSWPDMLSELGEAGKLVDLSPFISTTVLNTNYADTWIDQGKANGTLYGIWFNASNKSLVWYDPSEFSTHSWLTPTSWTEMMTLSEVISNTTGTPPWSIGNESGGATGWPLTDWFENILLRSAGPDIYDGLIAHDIPWTHTEVISALTYFDDIFGNEAYQVGGKSGTLNTFFVDAIYPPFEVVPEAYLHSQAIFVESIIKNHFPTQTPGVDFAVIPFPDIGSVYANAVVGVGDIAMVFTDTTEVHSLINFLITVDAAEIWIGEGNLSPNRNVDENLYTDPNVRDAANYMANANIVRFDLSDQLSTDMSIYMWSQMDDLVQAAPDREAMEEVFARMEARATHPYHIYLPTLLGAIE
ncbi:MAG: carbohydrate ABC transporter substrate-binding protein [Anaerolineales bacterium]|nr:carbohydrate ABC transporter substrate-binding protein [Anaerolineales bacterium]